MQYLAIGKQRADFHRNVEVSNARPEREHARHSPRTARPVFIALVVIVVIIGIANISSLLSGNKRAEPQSALKMIPTTPNAQQVSSFETQQQL